MALIAALSVPYLYLEAEAAPEENILDIKSPVVSEALYGGKEFTITIVNGTFQFCSGANITAENPTYTIGDELVLSLSESSKLHILATAQNDSFKISG